MGRYLIQCDGYTLPSYSPLRLTYSVSFYVYHVYPWNGPVGSLSTVF